MLAVATTSQLPAFVSSLEIERRLRSADPELALQWRMVAEPLRQTARAVFASDSVEGMQLQFDAQMLRNAQALMAFDGLTERVIEVTLGVESYEDWVCSGASVAVLKDPELSDAIRAAHLDSWRMQRLLFRMERVRSDWVENADANALWWAISLLTQSAFWAAVVIETRDATVVPSAAPWALEFAERRARDLAAQALAVLREEMRSALAKLPQDGSLRSFVQTLVPSAEPTVRVDQMADLAREGFLLEYEDRA